MSTMGRFAWLLVVVIAGQALLRGALGDGLISFDYPDFVNATTKGISLVNSATATPDGKGISLCLSSQPGTSAGMMWYANPIQVRGFHMVFNYTVSDLSGSPQRRDGMAFVLQQEGNQAFGPGGAGLGYGDYNTDSKGITQSVAIEFDTFYDASLLDPYNFHISVHVNPTGGPNSANESYSIWRVEPQGPNISTQVITIDYVPWPQVRGLGLMTFLFNGYQVGFFNLSLDNYLALDDEDYAGSAYVGFTGSHSPGNGTFPGETITINSWKFGFTGVIQASSSIIFGLDNAEAGAGLVFYLQTVDNFGYNMTTDSIAQSGLVPLVTLTQPDSSQLNGTIIYGGNGLYKLFVNATISGNATVRLLLGSHPIGLGTYSLSVVPTVPDPDATYPYGLVPQEVAGSIGSFWVQLRDVYNNNITTDAFAPTVSITATGFSQPAIVSFDATTGRYLVSYNVTLAGVFTISVALNGSPTSDPTHPLEVIPAALDSGNSLAYGMATGVVAGTEQAVYVQLRDVFGNNVTDDTANVTLSIVLDAIEVFGTRTDLGDGLYSFTYNATTMGTYHLVPLVNGAPLSTSTGYYTAITVAPSSINPTVSYAYGQGLTQGTAGYLGVLYVQLTDSFGNNVSVPTVAVSATLTDYPNQPVTTPLTAVGLFMISYNVTVAATYSLEVTVQGATVTYGASTVTIAPAEVDPVSCVAYGDGLTGSDLVVGNLNEFFVQLRDRYLNNITSPEAPLDVVITDTVSPLAVNVTPVFVFESGTYQVSYNITLASDYLVSLTVAGDPILNPLTNLTLSPAPINPSTCVATGDLETDAVAGVLRTFQVQLRDVYSNNVVDVPSPDNTVSAQFTSPGLPEVPITITYTEAGLYTCTYNATVTGSYTLEILVFGDGIANASTPVQVVPAPAYPPYCMAEGQALTVATAGALVSFSIYLYDVFNNSIPPTILAPVVSITTPTEQPVDITPDETQGTYTATYNITQSATYTVAITIGDVQIGTPPASLVVNPAPLYISNSVATGPSTATGTAGTQAAITVFQRDVYGNNIKDYSQVTGFYFTMTLASDPTITTNTSYVQNGDGSYALNYETTLAGTYVLTITINGANIYGSPFSTVVNPANFDPHGTTTVGLETSVIAGENNTFSVQLRDVYGNDITENVVSPENITLTLNGEGVENEISLVGEGVYNIVYNQTVAGIYNMDITIDAVEIGTAPIPQITVNPADTFPPLCTAVGEATQQAFIKRDNSFILIVRDRYGNHRNGSNVEPTITLSATGEQTVFGAAVLNPDGNYTVTYAGVDAKATYVMAVTFQGEHIHGSPFAVVAQYSNDAPNTAMIVGIVIGCAAFVGIAAFFGYRLYKKRHGGYEYLA